MLVRDTFLPHCWVCGTRFSNQLPPGPALEERHHIVPRAFGGVDGPQVSLCDKHHSKVHRTAEALLANKSYQHLMSGENQTSAKKLLWLASVAARATRAMKNDVNKPQRVGVVLDREHQHKLQVVRRAYGLTNNPDALIHTLDMVYSHLEGSK